MLVTVGALKVQENQHQDETQQQPFIAQTSWLPQQNKSHY